jgi:replicative DNA helicase
VRRDVLGCQVRGDDRRVLYLAMDRPKQSARALRRIFTAEHRDLLDARLIVRKGPLPEQITSDPTVFARLAAEHDAGLVIVDGLKDATSELNGDEAGLACNQAMQSVIAAGRELVVLHHLRIGVGGGKPSLDDLYGSTWICAGAGSIIALQGTAGDVKVKLHHLKAPVEAVGPWDVALNPANGTLSRVRSDDLERIVLAFGASGADARQVALALYGGDPTEAMLQRVARELNKRAGRGDFVVKHGKRGGKNGSQPHRYFATTGPDPFMGQSNTDG